MDGAATATAVPENALDPMFPRLCRIERVIKEQDDTFTLVLRPEDGGEVRCKPGQFNMLYMFGAGEVPISVSGDTRNTDVVVHTIREVGAVTTAMARLKRGDQVGLRGPFGRAWPVEAAFGSDVVFVTGTIGLAPLRPLVYEVLAQREQFGKVVMCYGSRGPDDILFLKDLREWRSRLDMQVHVTVHAAHHGYRGRVGSVAETVRNARVDGPSTVAFVCRSEVMTRPAVQALNQRGVTNDRIWVTLERNMKCGIGHCGHCQFGSSFMCKDGPVYRFDEIAQLYRIREL